MSAAGPRIILRWAITKDGGWQPIAHLATLLARTLGAEVEPLALDAGMRLRRLARAVLPSRSSGEDVVIYLVFTPRHIGPVVSDPAFDRPAALRVLWIVDSFWTEELPRRLLRNFDRVIYMQSEEAALYETATGGSALCLPWGADVLELGAPGGLRSVDILRVGRQPKEWADDDRSARAAAMHGLRFNGRPPMDLPYVDLMEYYRDTRFVVAFSNLAAPARYTHPTKGYFTGRWTDALANGAIVAGIHPMSDRGFADLLWEGALLPLERIDLEENLAEIARVARSWSPEAARRNYVMALERLDWRWRIRDLVAWLGVTAPVLDEEIMRVADRLGEMRPT